jgi:hypothetical protein
VAGVTDTPDVVLTDAGYWHTEQAADIGVALQSLAATERRTKWSERTARPAIAFPLRAGACEACERLTVPNAMEAISCPAPWAGRSFWLP